MVKSMIDNNTTASNNLSNNDVVSGNFSQNTLVSFAGVFNGLEKSIGLLIPSVRNVLVERYRAETTALILDKAIKIIEENGLTINSIPPKGALPLFDKLSLEHEKEMYDIWANLLVNASMNYDPIYILYSEILSKISNAEAKLLLEMYHYQTKHISFMAYSADMGKYYQEMQYFNTSRFIFKDLQIKVLETLSFIKKSYKIPPIIFIKIKHCFKKLTIRAEKDFRNYASDLYDMSIPFEKKEYKHSLEILKSLGLITGEPVNMPILSILGCDFVRTLEREDLKLNAH